MMEGDADGEETLDFMEQHGDRNDDDDLDDDEDSDDSPDGSQASTSEYEPSSPIKRKDANDPYPGTKTKIAILNYWRGVQGKRRSWDQMTRHYRSLRHHSVGMLYGWERSLMTEEAIVKRERMKEINKTVRTRFESNRDHGLPVHEVDLRVWALERNDAFGEQKIANFKASQGWVRNFKAQNRIGNRKITRVSSAATIGSAGEKLTAAADFVDRVRQHISLLFSRDQVFNTDQSGFEREMHRHHTLEFIGTQMVTGVAQSVSATTHSYTIQPTFSMDGLLMAPLLVILQESEGKFGPQVERTMYRSSELFVVASSSGKITKKIMDEWFRHVYLANAPSDSLLLLDSLSTYKTIIDASEKGLGDRRVTIEVIPPHTTGMIQPADCYFFRVYKSVFRRISDHVIVSGLGDSFKVFQRDNILKMQAVVHHQFRSPRFQQFLQYSWHKAGYVDDGPEHLTPMQYCFPKETGHCDSCSRYRLIVCGWCKRSLCFDHLLLSDVHMCENFDP